MSDVAVVFDGVWKKFRRGERHDSLRDLVPSLARQWVRRRPDSDLDEREFWALRDVSFQVRCGEALGIIGPNGAGKSTTLKLLTKILKATRGHCNVRGRVGALIEVAAGFHPDLTGRENIYLQGAILGMKRGEIARKFDEIVEFAGVNEFIDTPVKRYSTGMSARLGFSIAAHLDPDVLLIDEVLGVGDVAFQQKCYSRMRAFCDQGVALVFVSHNLPVVVQLCQRTLLLDGGSVVRFGATSEVVGAYAGSSVSVGRVQGQGASIRASLRLEGRAPSVSPGDNVHIDVEVHFETSVRRASVGIVVWDVRRNLYVYGASSDSIGVPLINARPGDQPKFAFTFVVNLTRGAYGVEVNVFDVDRQRHLAVLMLSGQFTVIEHTSHSGIANLYLRGRRLTRDSPGPLELSSTAATQNRGSI